MNEALPYKFWGIEGGEIPVPPFRVRVLWNPPFKDEVVPKKVHFIWHSKTNVYCIIPVVKPADATSEILSSENSPHSTQMIDCLAASA